MTRLATTRGAIAFASVALLAMVSACETVSVNTIEVGRVEVTPVSLELVVGEVVQLTATVRDQSGSALPGRSISWASSDPTVASVDPDGRVVGLAPGTSAITATSGGAAGSSVASVGMPAALELSTTEVDFVASEGATGPPSKSVQVTNGGGVSLTDLEVAVAYDSQGSGWLETSLTGTTAPATLTLTPLSGSLSVGEYSATVEIRSSRTANSPQSVRVTLTVRPSGPAIGVSPDSVVLQGRPGASDTVAVVNAGGGTLAGLTVSVQYPSGGTRAWLSATLTGSSAPASILLNAVASGLTAGVHLASVAVSSNDPDVATVVVPVRYQVAAAPSALTLSPNRVTLAAAQGQATPATASVSVTNGGGGTVSGLSKAISYGPGQPNGWLTANLTGTTAPATLALTAAAGGLPVGTYDASVEVSGSAPNSPQFVSVTFVVGPPAGSPPAAPSGLSANAVDSTTIGLTWIDNASDEIDFDLERSDDGGQSWAAIQRPHANAVAATDGSLSPGKSYLYRIRACNAAGCSAYSNVAAATTPVPTPPPNPPTGVSVQARSAVDVDLSWTDASTNETRFEIGIRTQQSAWTLLGTVPRGTQSVRVNGLGPGVTYEFRVRACNGAACSAWAGPVSVTMPNPTGPPNPPSNLQTVSVGSGRVDLRWKDNSNDETGFLLQRAVGLFGSWQNLATPSVDTETYSDTAVQSGTFYYYRVAACNPAGCSAFSSVILVLTP